MKSVPTKPTRAAAMKAKARFVPDAFPRRRAGRYMPRPDTSGSHSRENLLRSAEEIDELGNSFNVRDLVSDSELSSARKARTPNPLGTRNADRANEMALSSLAPRDEDLEPTGPINSDEETEAVMAGIARSRPQPIAQHVPFDLRRRNEIIAIKAELRANWRGQDGKGLFAQHAYPETWYRAPGLGPGGPEAGGRNRETIVREAARMAEIEAGAGYSAASANAGHAAAFAAGVEGGNGEADDDEDAEPEVPEWQLKMRTAKQMLDEEDRAIADGRIKPGEAPSMARAETLSDGRQIVRVSPPPLEYE